MKFKITPGSLIAIVIAGLLLVIILSSLFMTVLNWKAQIAVGALILLAAFVYERKDKKKKANSKDNLAEAGKLLFPDAVEKYVAYYNLYLQDRKKFTASLPNDWAAADLSEIEPIDVLFLFADSRSQAGVIDWKGEENEGEVEESIDQILGTKTAWTATTALRSQTQKAPRDGEFILELFAAIDKDLQAIDKKLLFFNTNSDSYAYTVVNTSVYKTVTTKAPTGFKGVEEL
ncbi:MAG: hypothetical protein JST68_17265 [Bacteroidetes bacterium]|nr:hypothetical protein [Bacteroidota bacterium]